MRTIETITKDDKINHTDDKKFTVNAIIGKDHSSGTPRAGTSYDGTGYFSEL